MRNDLWSKGPWGLLGAALIVLTIERAVTRHDLHFCRTENIDLRMSRYAAHAKNAAVGSDVLCFGTSMIQQGILPRIVERRTGLKVYNLAVGGGRVQQAYYTLHQALAAGARPSAVLVDFHPSLISFKPEGRGHIWADVLGIGDCFDMARVLHDPDLFTRTMLAKTVPMIYHRYEVRAWLVATVTGGEFSHWQNNLTQMRHLNRNKGAWVRGKNPEYHGEISPGLRANLLEGAPTCNPSEGHYIHKLIDLAAAHGVRVYWVIVPFAPALQTGREANGLDAAYTRIASAFTRHPNLVVVDARRSGYDASVFSDASHLDPDGAATLSTDIAELLLRSADGSKWVAMPAFHRTPIDVPFETVTETHIALAGHLAVRK